jgi:tRNA pseudouridine65 synthase
MQRLRIIYQDEDLVVIDKPAGFHVHAPEDHPNASNVVLQILRNQIGKYLYPVHRLDRATTGVLVFALNSESAAAIQTQFRDKTAEKSYFALVRGWTEKSGIIDSPLTRRLDGGAEVDAKTDYETLFCFERNETVGKFTSARYSFIEVKLHTGRLHQIRRHLKRISHPLVGDTVHGDGKHNQLWRTLAPGSTLYLKAYRLQIRHPRSGEALVFHSKWNHSWHQLFDLAGFCPYFTVKTPSN